MRVLRSLLIVATVTAVVVFYNWYAFDRLIQSDLAKDHRNEKVSVHVYSKWAIRPDHLVFDVWGIDGEASMADVSRTFFISAASLKDWHFKWVTLAYLGQARFVMDGDDFRALGREYDGGQNPGHLIRTWPEKLQTPDGQRAYGSWTGGLLGVLGKQMEDLSDMHRRWYLDDIARKWAGQSKP